MKKIFTNLAITISVMLIVILVFSFIMWNIQWVIDNTFLPAAGRTFSLMIGALVCAAINDCKKNN